MARKAKSRRKTKKPKKAAKAQKGQPNVDSERELELNMANLDAASHQDEVNKAFQRIKATLKRQGEVLPGWERRFLSKWLAFSRCWNGLYGDDPEPLDHDVQGEPDHRSERERLLVNRQRQLEEAKGRTKFKHMRRTDIQDSIRAHNGIVKRCCMKYGYSNILKEVLFTDAWKDKLAYSELIKKERAGLTGGPHLTNHFPGMIELASKCTLTEVIHVFQQEFPHAFRFYPPSVNLDLSAASIAHFLGWFDPNKTYISKPSKGLRGEKIGIFQDAEALLEHHRTVAPVTTVQEYIAEPATIGGGYKFDFRIYAFITDYEPLTCYSFHEGLVRIATQKYVRPTSENLDKHYMHLTNHSLNKNNEEFFEKTTGKEKLLTKPKEGAAVPRLKMTVVEALEQLGIDPAKFWKRVDEIVALTFLALKDPLARCTSHVFGPKRAPWGCRSFQMIGFDLMLSSNLEDFHLMEINQNPSLYCRDSVTDAYIKEGVYGEAMRIMGLVSDADKTPSISQNTYVGRPVAYSVLHPTMEMLRGETPAQGPADHHLEENIEADDH